MNYFSSKKPYFIAGPCGAEDELQLQNIANSFKHIAIDMIRAGVWKPRSKPGHFEGRGEEALKWLSQLKNISSLPICIEVANKEQVELALKYGIDAIWIGARTTVNPFIVQEIADAVKGNQVGVLVKNPINPDIELWSGALERFSNAGIDNLAAIHRGFSSYDTMSIYRNKPNWAIPIELKRRYKDIPIFCDASHICGNRELIPMVSQRALDLDFDGLMIETHPNPDQALSDAKQQLTPDQLSQLLSHLIIRKPLSNSSADEIEQIRQILDSMDAEVVDLIGKRMELVAKLGKIKGDNNMPIYQADRWREIVKSRTNWGEKNGLDAEFMLNLFELIHDKSIKTQIHILNELAQDRPAEK
jgi:chorismate mutase